MSRTSAKPTGIDVLIKQADTNLIKDLTKLFNRIEKIFIPSGTLVYDEIFERLDALSKEIQKGFCLVDVNLFSKADIDRCLSKNSEFILRKIDWDIFTNELIRSAGNGVPEYQLPPLVIEEIEREKEVHEEKLKKAFAKEQIRQLQVRNNQPIMQGKWRKEPFTARVYEPIDNYVVTQSIKPEEGEKLLAMLKTPLNGYLGQAYNYDDHGLTEEWMTTFADRQTSAPSDKDVIRTQLVSLLEIMMAQVQDRVCTEEKVLEREPLQLGKDVKEVPVWGIDCYTRRMIELAIEDRVPGSKKMPFAIQHFIEKTLLPTINEQPPHVAHDMKEALASLLKRLPEGSLDRSFAEATLVAVDDYGIDNFRIHPKGTGVICIRPEGIPAHVLVTEYLGELYPPYRWCEKLDVVEQAQEKFELKPTLPDFYNILLERPRQDPDGYGLLYVDASQRANIGSSCSHSCEANCTSAVVARQGKLTIALTTNRHINYGEELTMDYYSITTSDVEWRAAVCLCGMKSCRGSFLHYATQDELQQILNQNYGPLWRYASLLRACSPIPASEEDKQTLARHGIQKSALGDHPPAWVIKYVAEILRFIEYERKALPCALLRKNEEGAQYSYSHADMDARSVMEQRIQSMICCFSMVMRIIRSTEQQELQHLNPLAGYDQLQAIQQVYLRMKVMPSLLQEYLLKPLQDPKSHGENDHKKGKPSQPSNLHPDPIPVKIENIQKAIQSLQDLLKECPSGMAKLRELCLSMRSILNDIEGYSTACARLNQLNDILVLWAFTTNYSFAQEYKEVKADPITVVARELGTSIPRNKIYAAFQDNVRRRANRLNPSKNAAATTSGNLLLVSPTNDDIASRTEEEGWADTTTESIDAPSPVNHTNSYEGDRKPMELEDFSEATDHPMTLEDLASPKDNTTITTTATDSPAAAVVATGSKKESVYLSPNEPVFMGQKVYAPLFCFWQLLGWFNAGTDQKIVAPDVFGCTQLPEPSQCFGQAEQPYGEKQREILLEILKDEKKQTMPWPQALKASFSSLSATSSAPSLRPLYGSPMLDIALGKVDAVVKVLRELKFQESMIKQSHTNSTTNGATSKTGKDSKKKSRNSSYEESTQYDNILPPELPTNWVQCEKCKKWRRLAWHIDVNSLPDAWECPMNTWDIDNATCLAPQDSYDPQKENTFELKSSIVTGNASSELIVGEWYDVYCVKNHVYYEAQIKKQRIPKKASEVKKYLFHYKGWSPKFDEWIAGDSERIQPHHLFTNPDARDPRQQEAWQGLSPLKSVIRSAFSNTSASGSGSKKRASSSGSAKKSTKRRRTNEEEEGENTDEEGMEVEESEAPVLQEIVANE